MNKKEKERSGIAREVRGEDKRKEKCGGEKRERRCKRQKGGEK